MDLRHQCHDLQDELNQYKTDLEQLVESRTAELLEARDAAEAASRAKGTLLATVSHELCSPPHTVLLLSSPDSIDPDTSDASRHDLSLIHRSGEGLLHLIRDVLESARVETGQVVVENAPFDLSELIREVRDLLQVAAEKKSL